MIVAAVIAAPPTLPMKAPLGRVRLISIGVAVSSLPLPASEETSEGAASTSIGAAPAPITSAGASAAPAAAVAAADDPPAATAASAAAFSPCRRCQ